MRPILSIDPLLWLDHNNTLAITASQIASTISVAKDFIDMVSYILRRLLATTPVMFVVAVIVFSLLYLSPGDPATVLAGEPATTIEVEQLRVALGLNEPFLTRFMSWFSAVLTGDLDTSIFSGRPVASLII